MLVALVAEGVALLLLAVLVLGLLRSHALILKALHDLGAGLVYVPVGDPDLVAVGKAEHDLEQRHRATRPRGGSRGRLARARTCSCHRRAPA